MRALLTNTKPTTGYSSGPAKGARSGLKNHRTQHPDTNIWKQLLEKRRGYFFAAHVLGRILGWARCHKKQEVGENKSETTEQGAILELFRAEMENSFEAASKRRAGGSSSSFQIVEHEGIIMIQGRK